MFEQPKPQSRWIEIARINLRVGLVLAVGAEAADKEVIHNGETETEQELALLVRVGVTYGFRLTPEASIGPTLLVDQVGDRTTVVLGMSMVVGF